MKRFFLRSLFRRRHGASTVEYGLLVGLIAVTMILAVGQTGGSIKTLFEYVSDSLLGNRIELSNDTIAENTAADTTIGLLSFKGIAAPDMVTFSLTDTRFTINGNALKTAVVFDYELITTITLPVTVTTADDDTFTQNVTITITNQNESPTAPVLTCITNCAVVPENTTTVGTVTATDPDGTPLTYSLPASVTYPDNDLFTIDAGGILTVKAGNVLDYESAKKSYSLWIVASDGTLSQGQAATFSLANVADSPANVALKGTAAAMSLTNASPTDATRGVVYEEQTLTFENTGELATSALLNATLSPATGSGFEVKSNTCATTTLSPLGANTCTVVIRAVATANGTLTGATLTVGNSTTPLTGSASGLTAALSFDSSSPTTVTGFSSSTGTSACTALVVKNTGHLPIAGALTAVLSGTNTANFTACTAASNACSATLAIGATCNLGVQGKALANGSYTAEVTANVSGVSPLPTQNISLTASALNYATCNAILARATTLGLSAPSGVYTLHPASTDMTFYCDMTTSGGPYTYAVGDAAINKGYKESLGLESHSMACPQNTKIVIIGPNDPSGAPATAARCTPSRTGGGYVLSSSHIACLNATLSAQSVSQAAFYYFGAISYTYASNSTYDTCYPLNLGACDSANTSYCDCNYGTWSGSETNVRWRCK